MIRVKADRRVEKLAGGAVNADRTNGVNLHIKGNQFYNVLGNDIGVYGIAFELGLKGNLLVVDHGDTVVFPVEFHNIAFSEPFYTFCFINIAADVLEKLHLSLDHGL